jgi:hypothetical protein
MRTMGWTCFSLARMVGPSQPRKKNKKKETRYVGLTSAQPLFGRYRSHTFTSPTHPGWSQPVYLGWPSPIHLHDDDVILLKNIKKIPKIISKYFWFFRLFFYQFCLILGYIFLHSKIQIQYQNTWFSSKYFLKKFKKF